MGIRCRWPIFFLLIIACDAKIFAQTTNSLVWTQTVFYGDIFSISWSPDSKKIASIGWAGDLKLWDVETGQMLGSFWGHTPGILAAKSVAWSPDGSKIATGGYKEIVVWDAKRMQILQRWSAHLGWINSIAWSPDSKYIAVGSWVEVGIWDPTNATLIKILNGHYNDVSAVNWSKDGRRIISASADRSVLLWDVNSSAVLKKVETNKEVDAALSMAWSPSAQIIATGNYRRVRFIDSDSLTLLKEIMAFPSSVRTVAWSIDGHYLATGCSFLKGVNVLDAKTGTLAEEYFYPDTSKSLTTYSVAWSPDGKFIASGSGEFITGYVTVWKVNQALTNIDRNSTIQPHNVLLLQNFPNPFNPTTNFEFQLPHKGYVTLRVFDLLGRELATLVNEEKPPGVYKASWDASEFPSGVYLYQLRADNFIETKKMVLMK